MVAVGQRFNVVDGLRPGSVRSSPRGRCQGLHILSMFTAVTPLISVPIFAALAVSQRDVRGLAAVYRLARRPANTVVGRVFLLAGVVFGLLTAATGGFDFLAGWLIAAYVMVTAFILTNFLPAKHRCGRWPMKRLRRRQANARSMTSFAIWRRHQSGSSRSIWRSLSR